MTSPERPRVELRLLGQTLSLRSTAPPEYLKTLAAHIEERVTVLQRAGVRDPMMALTLAALEITDDLFRSREAQSRGDADVRTRLERLLALLDDVQAEVPERGSGRGDSA